MASLKHLLFSFEGRIGRRQFWEGVLVLAVANLLIALVLMALIGWASSRFPPVLLLVKYVSLVPVAALCAKRLHDRNRSGWWVALIVAPGVVSDVADALGLAGNPRVTSALDFAALSAAIVSLWFVVEICVQRGTAGANHYGADPLGPEAAV